MIDFDYCFNKLTDNEPFAWQSELFARLTRGEFPHECDIPTGLGKTSVIAIWLLALADDVTRQEGQRKIPRRLVYVVDRRVIVDQATGEAERIVKSLKELAKTDERLRKVCDALKQAALCKDDVVVALSTLRGEHADNREWCLDPSRPAIIVGTVDMIGSRLLFSAYGGVGESYKALQAGLLGQDSLVAVDEAHLSPAFIQTLRALRQSVRRKNLIKPFEVISLSATPAVEEGERPEPFTLEKDAPEDLTNEVAAPRLNAVKNIEWKSFLVPEDLLKGKKADKAKELLRVEQAKEMATVAAQYKDRPVSVLIFGTTVNLVKEIKKYLIEAVKIDEAQILLMVGGMRGYERDNLVENPVFKMFSPHRRREAQDKAYFLVATSCAEVGVNLDADFAVCDPASADSFIQRLGRVNRFGNTSSVVHVVHEESLMHESEQAKATLAALKGLGNGDGLNASPLALRAIEFPEICYPPKPVCPPLDPARLDDWSMTSLKQNEFRRPLVSYWLRGVTENTTPETSLCWRADFKEIGGSEKPTGDLKKDEAAQRRIRRKMIAAVKTVRVKSRECARESTGRAMNTILAISQKFPEGRAVVISASNEYEVYSFAELSALNEKKELFKKLIFATVVLPCEVGGLDKDGIAVDELSANTGTVLDRVDDKEWRRVSLTESEDGVNAEIIGGDVSFYPGKNLKAVVLQLAEGESKRCIKQISLGSDVIGEDDEEKPVKKVMAYFINRKSPESYLPNEAEADDETEGETASVGYEKDKSGKGGEVSLEKHNSDVRRYAQILAEKLHLSAEFAEALAIAGAWHDKGKDRRCWQMAVGNPNPEIPIAKSKQTWFNHKLNNYYRHEFGSLVEADADEELKRHPERDLILHLIATHHGYARPHFPERAFDKDNPTALNRDIAEAAMRRFANLQIRFGWWQLAYLEAILKAADALASRAEARGEI
jgi:CRISPR-associated endonuclease/helicase Cas3